MRFSDVTITLELGTACTFVHATMTLLLPKATTVVLPGKELDILALQLNGKPLQKWRYHDDYLRFFCKAGQHQFSQRLVVYPKKNTVFEGLYCEEGMLCTQMEAEGFRRLLFYPDYPSVRLAMRVRLKARQTAMPTVLCNGIPKVLPDEGQWSITEWYDSPKPSYLFALVAGTLFPYHKRCHLAQKSVDVTFWSTQAQMCQSLEHAVTTVCAAMQFDASTWGQCYDLPHFHGVALHSFNAGAMENRALNLFSVPCVVYDAIYDEAKRFEQVRRVVAHEYFHHGTGWSVGIRAWRYLGVKEGLTTYREQRYAYACDRTGTARLEDVLNYQRRARVEESKSDPLAPQPTKVKPVDHIYGFATYEKSAEILRMGEQAMGQAAFDQWLRQFLQRYAGRVVGWHEVLAGPLAWLTPWIHHQGQSVWVGTYTEKEQWVFTTQIALPVWWDILFVERTSGKVIDTYQCKTCENVCTIPCPKEWLIVVQPQGQTLVSVVLPYTLEEQVILSTSSLPITARYQAQRALLTQSVDWADILLHHCDALTPQQLVLMWEPLAITEQQMSPQELLQHRWNVSSAMWKNGWFEVQVVAWLHDNAGPQSHPVLVRLAWRYCTPTFVAKNWRFAWKKAQTLEEYLGILEGCWWHDIAIGENYFALCGRFKKYGCALESLLESYAKYSPSDDPLFEEICTHFLIRTRPATWKAFYRGLGHNPRWIGNRARRLWAVQSALAQDRHNPHLAHSLLSTLQIFTQWKIDHQPVLTILQECSALSSMAMAAFQPLKAGLLASQK